MTAPKLTMLLFLLSAFKTGFIDAFCGYTYVSSTRGYYKLHTENATWYAATNTCQADDARLFHPDSAEELEQVLRALAVYDSGVQDLFTGLSDLEKLHEYKTEDGRPISQVYNKWGSGEPTSWWGAWRCGVIVVHSRLLYSRSCDGTIPFICKHEEEVKATDVKTVTADAIRSDYAYISPTSGGYYKYHTKLANWTDAVSTCQSEGAQLFYPESAEELELVWTQLAVGNNDGGRDLRVGLSWSNLDRAFKTVDGRPISQVYNKWLPGEPQEQGVAVSTYQSHLLGSFPLNDKLSFICKHKKMVTGFGAETVTADATPSGYTLINSTPGGYYKYHTERATWGGAVSACRSEGARLFHPDSADELKLMWSKLAVGNNDGEDLFIGLSNTDNLNEFKTVDGRPRTQVYNKWESGEPRFYWHQDFRCGILDSSTKRLHVSYCFQSLRFTCKLDMEATATDVTTVTADYTYINSTRAHYKLHMEQTTWVDAARTCRSEGARLFHPDSAEELEQVWRKLAVGAALSNDKILFTGLSDLDNIKEYKTVDGRPIGQVYNKWNSGQPYSCWKDQCRCGVLGPTAYEVYVQYQDVELYVYFCDETGRFICKRE